MALICNKRKEITDREVFVAVNLDLTEGEKLRTFYLSLFKKLTDYI